MTLEISKKVCMLGSFGVGKTSLVRRFVYNKFDEKYLTTIGVQVSHRLLDPILMADKSRVQVKVILWDLAHIEKMTEIIKNYFRGSHGAIVVYDLTRPSTYAGYDMFLRAFGEVCPKSSMIFVANKSDLLMDHNEGVEQFTHLAKAHNVPHFFTSAKSGENVDKAFHQLGAMMIEAK